MKSKNHASVTSYYVGRDGPQVDPDSILCPQEERLTSCSTPIDCLYNDLINPPKHKHTPSDACVWPITVALPTRLDGTDRNGLEAVAENKEMKLYLKNQTKRCNKFFANNNL